MLLFICSILSTTCNGFSFITSITTSTRSAFFTSSTDLLTPDDSISFFDLRKPAVSIIFIGTPDIDIFAST